MILILISSFDVAISASILKSLKFSNDICNWYKDKVRDKRIISILHESNDKRYLLHPSIYLPKIILI
jgi:hypothetical protein